MANTTIKLFESTAAVMLTEMRKMEARKGGIDQMLHGDGDSLNAAWGCSAVVLQNGEIQLVGAEAAKPVEVTTGGAVVTSPAYSHVRVHALRVAT